MKKAVYFGLVGLLLGVLLSWLAFSKLTVRNVQLTASPSPKSNDMTEGMTTDSMAQNLNEKSGDEFDKAFITGMIDHHEEAVEMAKLAEQRAKHEELKDMAKDVINTQSAEIDKMREWQRNWGY